MARRIAFGRSGPAHLDATAPTRVTLAWWDGPEPVLVEPPPSAPPGTYASTIVAVWPSREVVVWHLTEAQVERLHEIHARTPWSLDAHDVCVHPDGRIDPRLETVRPLLGGLSGRVGRLADALERRAA